MDKNGSQISSVLVHYIGWNNVYDEYIDISSQRLAQYKFYTHRQDIPHYYMGMGANSMHSYVVMGDQVPPNLPGFDFFAIDHIN